MHATFENVESKFNLTRCIRQGSVEAAHAMGQIGKAGFWECGEIMHEEDGVHVYKCQGGRHTQKTHLDHVMK